MSMVHTSGLTGLGVRTRTAGVLVAVVGALVLGIVGMHGLSQHGAATHAAQSVSAVADDPHAAHPAPDHTPVDTSADAAAVAADSGAVAASMPAEHGSAGDMVMLCVAMLLAAAVSVLLALQLVRHAHRAPLSLLPKARVASFPTTARVGTGPPAVWEFSVVRC